MDLLSRIIDRHLIKIIVGAILIFIGIVLYDLFKIEIPLAEKYPTERDALFYIGDSIRYAAWILGFGLLFGGRSK